MVTRKEPTPTYSLDRIRALAADGEVIYGTSRAECDAETLQYDLDAVCRCLGLLKKDDFEESIHYDDAPPLDVYKITVDGPTDDTDELYIKLMLNRDCVLVVVMSFHLDR